MKIESQCTIYERWSLHQSTVAKDSVHGITQLAKGAEDVVSFANAESTREDRDNPFMETAL